jgi:hypothetical protein
MRARFVAVAALLTGCHQSPLPACAADGNCAPAIDLAVNPDFAAAIDLASSPDLTVGPCQFTGGSDLAGVTIEFPEPVRCSYTLAEAAAGITIPYDVVIAMDVDGVVSMPQDAGMCQSPGASGLAVFERLNGNGQGYCLCDVGLCPGMTMSVTLRAGRYHQAFKWDGRNWGGPSDTGNPEGPPFPAGAGYVLLLSAKGAVQGTPFNVQASLSITLTP